MTEILIPSIDDYHTFEHIEAKRNIVSSGASQNMLNLKKIREKQIEKELKLKQEKLLIKERRDKKRKLKELAKKRELLKEKKKKSSKAKATQRASKSNKTIIRKRRRTRR